MHVAQIAALGAMFAAQAVAWNKDVHQQIGYASEEFLTPETKEILTQLLEPEHEGSLGRIAAWADDHRGTDRGSHTTTWHWVNPGDEPPQYCNVFFNRDCTEGGCVVSALANETQVLKTCIKDIQSGRRSVTGAYGSDNVTDTQCSDAVKLITHFTQDIAQPMHVTGIARGGNDIDVVFGGVETNLHAIWDGRIVYTLANSNASSGFNNESIDPFFANMVDRIRADNYFSPTDDWTSCTNPGTPLACPMDWARDTNVWNCDYAFSQVYEDADLLSSGYAAGAWPIAEVQMAKAVLRTATWFNNLVEGAFKEREVILDLNPSWADGPNNGS